jgi:predicted nuclease with TOPRIM domain
MTNDMKQLDQEVVEYIESSATLIDNLNSEVKKLASEKTVLEQELATLKSEYELLKDSFKKQASVKPEIKIEQLLLTKDQADLIANNLVGLSLVKNASINDVSEVLQKDASKMVEVFNGLIAKVAANHISGRGVAPEKAVNVKQLTEEEQLEKSAFFKTLNF